jgi:hypothetical protein
MSGQKCFCLFLGNDKRPMNQYEWLDKGLTVCGTYCLCINQKELKGTFEMLSPGRIVYVLKFLTTFIPTNVRIRVKRLSVDLMLHINNIYEEKI